MITRVFKTMIKTLSALALLAMLLLAVLWVCFPFPRDRLEQWAVSPRVLDVKGRPMLNIVSFTLIFTGRG